MRAALALALALVTFSPLLHADGADWESGDGWKAVKKQEIKLLDGLMKQAVKADYRRQAWYFAERILAADPNHEGAIEVLETWSGRDLAEGQEPKKAWLKKRTNTLRDIGMRIFRFGETLEAAGVEPVEYYTPISLRISAYGAEPGPHVQGFRSAGELWCGQYGFQTESKMREIVGGELLAHIEFPPEFDDAALEIRARWPESRSMQVGRWRLHTDLEAEEALRLIKLIADLDAWFVKQTGKRDKKGQNVTDIVLFSTLEKYDKYGTEFVSERWREGFDKTSWWFSRWNDHVLISREYRDNTWVGTDATLLGGMARALCHRHLAGKSGGRVQGRGAWLFDAVAGVVMAVRPDADGALALDPDRCWTVAAAAALGEQDKLMPWKDLYGLDLAQARKLERPSATVTLGGVAHEGKALDAVMAQGSALVLGIWTSDKKKGPKSVAKLVADLYKRDALPNVDKTIGKKAGTAEGWANAALDAVK